MDGAIDEADPSGYQRECFAQRRPYVGAYVGRKAALIVVDVSATSIDPRTLARRLWTLWVERPEEREPGRFLGNWIPVRSLPKRIREAQAVLKELMAAPGGTGGAS